MSETRKEAPSLGGPVIASTICVALGIILAFKIRNGLHNDQTFHIAGLYESLREPWPWPSLTTWNFRPVVYRVWLAVVSACPVLAFGWTNAAQKTAIFEHFLLIFTVIYLATGIGRAAGTVDRRHNWARALQTGLLVAVSLSTNAWSYMSADELAGLELMVGLFWANFQRMRSIAPRSTWTMNWHLAVPLAAFGYLFLFTKGITVAFLLPVGLLCTNARPDRHMGSVLSAIGLLLIGICATHLLTDDVVWLLETMAFKKDLEWAGCSR